MKIGVLGGSFDPPQNDHLHLALFILKNHYVDHVIFVPMKDNSEKPRLVDSHHRYQMLKRMIENQKDMSVSRIELDAPRQYKTYETLDLLQKNDPNDTFYFILGADNFLQLPTWAKSDYLMSHYYFLVSPRFDISIFSLWNQVNQCYPNHFFSIPRIGEISSTLVREKIKKKESISDYVPLEVEQYIKEYQLYEEGNL